MVTDSSFRNVKSSDRKQKALALGIPIVSLDYIHDCISSSAVLAVEPYIVIEKPKGM